MRGGGAGHGTLIRPPCLPSWHPQGPYVQGAAAAAIGRYLGNAVAGVEENGGVRVRQAILEAEELLSHVIPVVSREACKVAGHVGWAQAFPGHQRPSLCSLIPPAHTHCCPAGELTLIAQLQVQQGVDAAHSLSASGRPEVSAPWGEEANEEAQVVEGHQGLERQTWGCGGDAGGRQPEMALGLRSRWGGQVPAPPGSRYGRACDQRAALPHPRVGPKRDESWASRGMDRVWLASAHSSDTWESLPQKPRGATRALPPPWGLGLFFRAFPALLSTLLWPKGLASYAPNRGTSATHPQHTAHTKQPPREAPPRAPPSTGS